MGVDVGHKRVRAVGGGHSARHAERHEAAGYRTSYAPVWTDSAVWAVLEQLKADMAAWHTKKVGDYCLKVLSSDQDTASLLERTSRKLSLHDRGIAKAIVNAHSARVKTALAEGGAQAARLKVHSFLKPMRERAVQMMVVKPLHVEPVVTGPEKPAQWLLPAGRRGRTRDIRKCRRIIDGIGRWPLKWLKEPGFVCYERAAGRASAERVSNASLPDLCLCGVGFRVLPIRGPSRGAHGARRPARIVAGPGYN